MSHTVWRIATDTRNYEADDLTGMGAKITGGRWNQTGVAMVYAAKSRALACMETFVHLNADGLPLNRYLVAINVPDDFWDAARMTTLEDHAVGWDALPAGGVSVTYGTRSPRRSSSCPRPIAPQVPVRIEHDLDHGRVRQPACNLRTQRTAKHAFARR